MSTIMLAETLDKISDLEKEKKRVYSAIMDSLYVLPDDHLGDKSADALIATYEELNRTIASYKLRLVKTNLNTVIEGRNLFEIMKRQCPYCAKTIEAEAIVCPFCGADLIQSPDEIHQEEKVKTHSVAACKKCNVELVTKEKKQSVSVAGVSSACLFLIGIVLIFFNPLVALIIIILAMIIGIVGRGKKTVLVCPNCGEEFRTSLFWT